MSREPERPKAGQPVHPWAVKIWEYVRRNRVVAGPGILLRESSNGTVISARPGAASNTSIPPCAFGSVIAVEVDGEPEKHIAGGSVLAAGNTYGVASEKLPTTEGTWFAYVTISVVANTDDDGVLLLPGLASATAPSAITYASTYPAGSSPTVADPSGTITLPIGTVIVLQ